MQGLLAAHTPLLYKTGPSLRAARQDPRPFDGAHVMCFSLPWGRVSVVQKNRPSRPAKASYLHCSLPARILHTSQPKMPPCYITALLFSHCMAPRSQLVLIQHQHDATPSAPPFQFRARRGRAASAGQIPPAKTMPSHSRSHRVNSLNSHPHPWHV